MNRERIAIAAIVAVLVLVVLLRPRGGRERERSVRPVGDATEAPVPMRRPSRFALPVKQTRGAGNLPSTPVVEPTVAATPDEAAHQPEPLDMAGRSVWPVTAAGVEGAVVESLSDLRGCYEGWLLEDPDLAGRIVVELAIADQDGLGQVVEAVVTESSAGHEVFEACVTSVLGELAFDSPGNGTLVVSYPFLFARDGD